MRIRRLALREYRSYGAVRFEPDSGVTVLFGRNAQGKTNLMEAIVLCSVGRSHRTSHDRELIAWDKPCAVVSLEAEHRDGTHDVCVTLTRANSRVKQVCVGSSPVARIGELMGHVPSVLFSPEDLKLVKEGPGERRRFMDMALSQVRPAYFYTLQRYSHALKQRGELLRHHLRHGTVGSREAGIQIDSWDEMLVSLGEKLIGQRAWFLERLALEGQRAHNHLSGSGELLAVEYECSFMESADVGGALASALRAARSRDERQPGTSVGPHRDDFSLKLNGRSARLYGSQGQQRTAALALKLGVLSIIRDELHETPVLLLDDVMSELDASRRQRLLTWMGSVQTIITCTDISDAEGAKAGKLYRIDGGTIEEA